MQKSATFLIRIAPLILVDVLLALSCFIFAFMLRLDMSLLTYGDIRDHELFKPYLSILMLAPFIRVFCSSLFGMYDAHPQHRGDGSSTLLALSKSVTLGTAILIIFAFSYRGFFEYRDFSYSRMIFLFDWVLNLTTLSAAHLAIILFQRSLRRRGIGLRRIAVQGRGEVAAHMIRELMEAPEIGYEVVGYISQSDTGIAFGDVTIPYLGDPKDILSISSQTGLDEVVVTNSAALGSDILSFVEDCHKQGVIVKMALDFYGFLAHSRTLEELGGQPVVQVNEIALEGPSRVLKRLEDLVLAILGLIISAPLCLLIALLIKREGPGPIIFNQRRVGKNGRLFTMYKFRSMVEDADERKDEFKHMNEADGHIFKIKDDPRVTWIGRLIRRTGMDELPQLLNVLKGEMSFVGPRPPVPDEVAEYNTHERRRLATRPGITGLWQVNRSQHYSFDEVLIWDLYYIENWSFWLDFKIILKTFSAVIQGKAE